MTPRSTFALALCAYIAATGASLYTRRGGAENERRQPSGRAAAPSNRSETAGEARIGVPCGVGFDSRRAVARRIPQVASGHSQQVKDLPAVVLAPSRYPQTIRWRTLVERVLNEQSGE